MDEQGRAGRVARPPVVRDGAVVPGDRPAGSRWPARSGAGAALAFRRVHRAGGERDDQRRPGARRRLARHDGGAARRRRYGHGSVVSTPMSRYENTRAALGICIAANVPVVLWGAPGQGKTSVVAQLARDQGLLLETVIASIREPSDFAGLPVVDAATGSVTLAPPRWAQSIAAAGDGVVFFDEMSTAPPAVQAAMLRVAVDR